MKEIIGYFHICQIGEWKKSFDLIFNYIKNYGLYDVTKEIRIGILSDTGLKIDDDRLNDPKFKIIHIGSSDEYERPTLLHMKKFSEIDNNNTAYWYLHSKGLRHFNTPKESFVIDWIKLMLYWNVFKWELALDKLNEYDTYGCNNLGVVFYSGNFWWATIQHIKNLPDHIPEHYIAPEEWVLKIHDKMYVAFSSGIQGDGHYLYNYPETNYINNEDLSKLLPYDFDPAIYKKKYNLNNLNYKQCADHYINKNIDNSIVEKSIVEKSIINNSINDISKIDKNDNINEKKKLNLPEDFDIEGYRENNPDLIHLNNKELEEHYYLFGKNENRTYKKLNLPEDFDIEGYKINNPDLKHLNSQELKNHYINFGINENRVYNKIKPEISDFDIDIYRENNPDLLHLNNQELIDHFNTYGKNEFRKYKIDSLPEDFNLNGYRNNNLDLVNLNDKELLRHYDKFGKYECRIYK